MISAILLAAGESKRMGDFKQLLHLNGKTFVECCVENLLVAGLQEVFVVTGHRDAEVRQALAAYPVHFVFNANYKAGMSSSLQCGVAALAEKTTAIVIALADQPQLDAEIIQSVIAAFAQARPAIAVPVYDNRRGHPIVMDAKLKAEILALDPQQGLRQVVAAHQAETLFVNLPDDRILIDFDYPQEFQAYLQPRK
ncbi:MAG: nucleotidyltransferase family protein [Acidobacteria bacterium]|nr:nucleotidyltransferase family protein [Acidobacteriota bacterium]